MFFIIYKTIIRTKIYSYQTIMFFNYFNEIRLCAQTNKVEFFSHFVNMKR
jgi:hypothetical protein